MQLKGFFLYKINIKKEFLLILKSLKIQFFELLLIKHTNLGGGETELNTRDILSSIKKVSI